MVLADAGHQRRGKELLDTEDSDFFRCKQASRKVNFLHRVFIQILTLMINIMRCTKTVSIYNNHNKLYYNILYTAPMRK